MAIFMYKRLFFHCKIDPYFWCLRLGFETEYFSGLLANSMLFFQGLLISRPVCGQKKLGDPFYIATYVES
jgi:hypothetical protein